MLTTRQMKHKVNLLKNISFEKKKQKKKTPIQQTAVSLLTPPPPDEFDYIP